MSILGVSGHLVHVLEMAAEISALRESLAANCAAVGPLARVLPEVILQIAALLEDHFTAGQLALKV